MGGIGRLDEWVERLDHAAVTTADSSLRRSGIPLPPILHLLSGRGDPPYVGSLVCRAFEPGVDAEVAVAAMGVLPAVLGADRVVVCWERVDLAAAFEVPGALGLSPGLVVLDASRDAHEVRFHPVRLRAGSDDGGGSPLVVPEWGPICRSSRAVLPEPVGRLLLIWRTQQIPVAERARVLTSLEQAGYRLFWTSRNPAEARPR